MTISLGGIGSGIDTGALVDGLMGAARLPLSQLDARKRFIDGASTTISTFSSRLSALKTAALALSTTVGFSAFSASSSDAAVVASVTGGASTASYAVEVNALARAQKNRSDVFASPTSALGMEGTLSLQIGAGDPTDITVTATDTLTDIANKIGGSGARVTASLMNTGSGYRLLVHGRDSGAENAFTMTETGTTLGLGGLGSRYETAQDASFTVDGIAVTSKTNQVSGVVPGLTLALTKVTTSPATVGVAGDTNQLKSKVQALVTAYNAMVSTARSATGFGSTKADNPVLAGDRSVRESLARVSRLVGDAVPGTSGRYTTLASVGITLKRDGTMSFDNTKMETALAADAAGVAKLFVTDAGIGSSGVMKKLMTAIDSLVLGATSPVQARLDALSSQSVALTKSRERLVLRLEAYETQLKKQFTVMDQVVSKYNALSGAGANITAAGNAATGIRS